MYKVTFYKTPRGEKPVEAFLAEMDLATRAKAAQIIGLLQKMGPQLRRPFADKLTGKIYELRPRQARVLFFFAVGRQIILVHGFLKKTNAVDRRDLDLAERRMKDWLTQNACARRHAGDGGTP